jgi:hypothetical protein
MAAGGHSSIVCDAIVYSPSARSGIHPSATGSFFVGRRFSSGVRAGRGLIAFAAYPAMEAPGYYREVHPGQVT